MLITLARLIEAWRDARIFNDPMSPRGWWWHVLKFPQYGCWLLSFYSYAALSVEWIAALWIIGDAGIAYLVFEYFLEKFRE